MGHYIIYYVTSHNCDDVRNVNLKIGITQCSYILAVCWCHPEWITCSFFSVSQDGCTGIFIPLIRLAQNNISDHILRQRSTVIADSTTFT